MLKRIHNKFVRILVLVLCAIVTVVILGIAVLMVVNAVGDKKTAEYAVSFDKVEYEAQLTPVTDKDGYTTFVTDGEFKIMQLTDIHLGGGCTTFDKDRLALNAVAAMVTAEKPDLVVVTGDLAFTVASSLSNNNKRVYKIFASMMDKLGVYWTVTFGNHDAEPLQVSTRKGLAKLLESGDYKYCVFHRATTDITGESNQVINVKNSLGVITQSLIIIDSNDYTRLGGDYDCIHDDQIAWYKDVVNGLNAQNAAVLATLDDAALPAPKASYETVKSLAFFHIPLEEYAAAWDAYEDSDANAAYYFGDKKEDVCCSEIENDLFETMLAMGSTKGVFVGHDHVNNYSVDYKGIRLTYGFSIDYLAYSGIDKKGAQRGCCMITTYADGSFECSNQNYYQDKYVSKYGKETVYMGN